MNPSRSLLTDEDRRRIVWVTLSEYHSAGDDGIVRWRPGSAARCSVDATRRGPALRRTVRSIMNDRGAGLRGSWHTAPQCMWALAWSTAAFRYM